MPDARAQPDTEAPCVEEATDSSMFAALKKADYACLWVGMLGSAFAMNMQLVAQGWLVYEMTSSAVDLALVTIAFMLPQVLFSLLGGVLADRLPKKPLIMACQALNGVATLVMAVIVYAGHVTFFDFIWVGFVNGTALALSIPARTAFIPELVGERLLFNAMAFNTANWNLARILGPALAGFMIAVFAAGDTTSHVGVGLVYFLLSGLYIVSSVTVMFIRAPGAPRSRPSGRSPLVDVREGLDYVLRSPVVGGLIVLSILPFLFGLPINTLLPAYNRDVLGGGPDDLGLLMTFMGVGAICGSLVTAKLGELRRKGFWVLASCAAWGLAVATFSITSAAWQSLAMIAAVGFASAVNMSMNRSLAQLAAAPEMRGRIMSIDMMSHGLMPLGMLPISLVAERYSVQTGLFFGGALLVVLTAACAYLLAGVRAIDRGYSEPAAGPTTPRQRAA